jgi:hypothetical protein
MIDYINIGLLLVIIYLEITQVIERRSWWKEREQLLNRIMAKTLPEYVEAESKLKKEAMKVVSVEELKRSIILPEPEQGIEI